MLTLVNSKAGKNIIFNLIPYADIRKIVFLWVLLWDLGGGAIQSSFAEDNQNISISNARLWAHPTYTRFVLEISAELKPKLFLLTGPKRLVIDFPEIEFHIPRDRQPHQLSAGIISKFRYGLLQPGTSRLVLDLAKPATVKRFFNLPPLEGKPYRFVLDLEPSTEDEFLLAVATNISKSPQKSSDYINGDKPVSSSNNNVPTIVIDAGHGGVDPGAIGRNGIYEKDIALSAAKELGRFLESDGKYRVVLTRSRDIFIPLRERVRIGRDYKANLFVSLHADSIGNKNIRGAHVYSLSENASDREAAALAAKENKADIIAGVNLAAHPPDVGSILLDLSQRETNNFSAKAGNILVQEWRKQGLKLLRKPHRQAGFAVLKAPDVPSILVELGFLSNTIDVRQLSTQKGRAPLLQALANSIDNYFRMSPIN